MEEKFNKIIKFLWILFFAFLILLIQFKLQASLRPLIGWIQRIESLFLNPVFWGFALGIIFGLITCPVCGVPLAAYVVGKEQRLLSSVLSCALFTLGRFTIFLILGIVAGIIGEAIVENSLFRILGFIFVLAGIFMITLSFDLMGLIDIRKHTTAKIINKLHLQQSRILKGVNHPVEYVIWGSLLGIVCSLEGFGFVLPVWTSAVAAGNIFYAVTAMIVFSLGAFIPPAILIFGALSSVKLADYFLRGNFMGYVRRVGAVVLFIFGCGYIFIGLKNAKLLLFGLG